MSKHVKLSDLKFSDDFPSVDEKVEYISSDIATINILFSADPFGGLEVGAINMISADSSLGKTLIAMKFLKNAQARGMDCYWIDSEKAFNPSVAKTFGIDVSEEKLTVFKTAKITVVGEILEAISKDKTAKERQNTFVVIDSWGALASPKSLEKVGSGSDKVDLTLAKWKNDLALYMKAIDVTFFVINHVVANVSGFGDPFEVPGGKKLYLLSQNVVMALSKAKDKDSEGEIEGALVTAYTRKGRSVKEFIKYKYRIDHASGLDPYYGLLPDAIEGGYIVSPKKGKLSRPCVPEDKEWREKDIYCRDFWKPIFASTDFASYLKTKNYYGGENKVESEFANEED